ncbi:ABC transporter ATP-binding protein [Clostridium perfringens]|uniref:ABC transporter ATP-binding protein n=1 Tax=Clostridium perfringens TaxID=1502 RepID=UPI00103CDEDF|nr:ATP-binding cassette domain-containing protein [Clostridium perfringens]TBX05613.1 sugar ABC transporter ATP-binding protein [Clostridium perfringens]
MISAENIVKEYKTYVKDEKLKKKFKIFSLRKKKINRVIDNISFNIKKGEIVGYIGSNGAGKSTTIKMMTGILTPTSGKCIVDGIEPYKNRMKNAKKIGVVFGQRTQLWWDLPLEDTFSILKSIYNISEHDFRLRMNFFNEVLELDKFIKNQVRTLSLGQRMRADIAAALIHNPKVLYLDEPTIGLDVLVKEKIRKAIKEINKEFSTTIILTTHDMQDINELCNRIIIIDKGKKIYDGNIELLKDKFGDEKNIEMDIKMLKQSDYFDICKNLKLLNEGILVDRLDNRIFIKFNRNEINVADIIMCVLSIVDVNDITIKETDLNDIVKKIYENAEGIKII